LYPECHLLVTRRCHYPVSAVMVDHVRRQIERWPRPRWITFVDLSGARIRVRASIVEAFEQSTPETRAWLRRVQEEQQQEDE
jgi:hypothetical protein